LLGPPCLAVVVAVVEFALVSCVFVTVLDLTLPRLDLSIVVSLFAVRGEAQAHFQQQEHEFTFQTKDTHCL